MEIVLFFSSGEWDRLNYLEVVFKLEGLVAVGALEFAQSSRFVVADHVTLEAIDVGKVLLANAARLHQSKEKLLAKAERKKNRSSHSI